jgi:hypothetical protein
MARYFSHLHDDIVTLDEEGMELPNLSAARDNAIATIRGLICGDVQNGWLDLRHRVEVASEDHQRLLTVAYAEALDLRH